ncbi:MAG TPA: XdhC family protein, partial [Dehalococcoidia bacterium]|nr:XdhC family protein [Dehalococcoidia bacterium]
MIPNDVLSEMVRLLEAGEGFALATLVDTHGSTPQKEGARLIVRADGGMAGTLGGGCIEAEAWEAAREVLRAGTPRVLDFELTEDIAVDYGLACGGREKMLVVPVQAGGGAMSFVRALRDAMQSGRRGMLMTVVRADDGAAAGASAAVWGDGAIDGTLAGLEDEAVTRARKALG